MRRLCARHERVDSLDARAPEDDSSENVGRESSLFARDDAHAREGANNRRALDERSRRRVTRYFVYNTYEEKKKCIFFLPSIWHRMIRAASRRANCREITYIDTRLSDLFVPYSYSPSVRRSSRERAMSHAG